MGRGKGGIGKGENGKGEERKEDGEGKEDEGGEKEGLPPLEWRSGYAPAHHPSANKYITHTHGIEH